MENATGIDIDAGTSTFPPHPPPVNLEESTPTPTPTPLPPSPGRTGSTSPGSASHKRNIPNSLFSRLSFSRGANADGISPDGGLSVGTTGAAPTYAQHGQNNDSKDGTGGGMAKGAMASALQQQRKTRKRKGSLRKTALLGTGSLRLEGREKRGGWSRGMSSPSPSSSSPPSSSPSATTATAKGVVDSCGDGEMGRDGGGSGGNDNDSGGGDGGGSGGGGLLRFPPLSPSALGGDEDEVLTPRQRSHDQLNTLPLSLSPNHPPSPPHPPPPIPPPPSRTWVGKGSPAQSTQEQQHQSSQTQSQEQPLSNTSSHSDNDDVNEDDEPDLLSFRSPPRQTPGSTSLTRLASNASTTTTTSTISTTPTTSSSGNSNSNSNRLVSSADAIPRRVPFKIPTPSSGSDSYFPPVSPATNMSSARLRSISHRVKSPLSLSGAETTGLGVGNGASAVPPSTAAASVSAISVSGVSGVSVSDDFPTATTATTAAAAAAAATSSTLDTWDYAETEWWGWIILIVTWLVFVIGMGSCLGVWSWAWDVGETPYAPPELEDDATLPIVGYYPALIILTAVMAWVWVVVAWVGMKYFRHANISGEDI